MEQNNKWVVTHYEKNNKSYILSALLHGGTVTELSLEAKDAPSLLGNIYIGKVKNLAPQIGAAFVEIAEGVICYYSLQEKETPVVVNRRHTDTKKPLAQGDEILVQISREALKTKAPTVTGNLNFPGKYLVLTSQKKQIGASSKLPPEERARLKALLSSHCAGSFGVIARTNACDIEEALLLEELEKLRSCYEEVLKKGACYSCFSLLHRQEPGFLSALRGIPQNTLQEIVTDDLMLYEALADYLKEYQPWDLQKLRLYEDHLLPMPKLYNLEKALEEALRERVWLKSGAYLVIQPTEALTVIDVNTGKFEASKKKQQTFRKINQEAAREIARQLRLRNLSGIIVADFIDMENPDDKYALIETLRQELKKDPVKTVLVDMTPLGLVEITRKKVRKTLQEQLENA